jgi:CHAD domain-containing protein
VERAGAHEQLAAELASPVLTKTVLGMSAWIEAPASLSGPADDASLGEPLSNLAPKLEARLERKVRRCGRHIRKRSEEELHDLRKALKKLRYSVEFLAPLHREDRLKSYLHRCKQLQEQLGEINDAAMAVTLTERLCAQDASLAFDAGALNDWANQHRAQAVAHLPAAWHEFKDAAFP